MLWIAVLSIVYTQLHREKLQEARNSFLTIEQTLTGTVTACIFMLFRISHGYASVRALMNQIRNPLLLRSNVSQFVCLLYYLCSLMMCYYVLLASAEESSSSQAHFALEWIMLVISVCNMLFVLEQFSHPQLVYCCDNDASKEKLRMRGKDAKADAENERTVLAPRPSTIITEIEDCEEESGDLHSLDV